MAQTNVDSDSPKIISMASKPISKPDEILSSTENVEEASPLVQAGPSTSTSDIPTTTTSSSPQSLSTSVSGKPLINHLILDAGPLLSLTPLRHLASKLYTTPAVIAELRDPKAREYLQRIKGGMEGIELKIEPPNGDAMARGML